jgi:hypothetical protein
MHCRILTTGLAIVYGAIVLPGHGGLHWLSGIDHCHAVPKATPADQHGHHFHHHQHDHSYTGDSNASQHPPEHQEHNHESDCEIRQWFAQGQISLSSTPVETAESTPESTLSAIVNPVEKSVFSVADPRGPPAAGGHFVCFDRPVRTCER